jgi:hypothetical protein
MTSYFLLASSFPEVKTENIKRFVCHTEKCTLLVNHPNKSYSLKLGLCMRFQAKFLFEVSLHIWIWVLEKVRKFKCGIIFVYLKGLLNSLLN